MDLLKLLNEEAAGGSVGAGAVATHAMPLFTSLIKREPLNPSTKPRKIKYSKKKKAMLNLKNTFESIADQTHDEIVAKLQSLERKNSVSYNNIAVFGLQDEDNNIIKISVPVEQAEGFERALGAFLADEINNEQNTPDIAEILWNLKDHFNIINVEWPKVEEDEEEMQTFQSSDNERNVQPKEPDEDISALVGADEQSSETEQAKNLLQQVVDMMKADAEARKKEAEAREKEAEAEIEQLAMKQAVAKVKQEEMFLDMEEYNQAKKAKEQEAKRLAKLAKWKHDIAKEQGLEGTPEEDIDLAMPSDVNQKDVEKILTKTTFEKSAEDEEFSKQTIKTKYNKASPDEITDFIVRRFK